MSTTPLSFIAPAPSLSDWVTACLASDATVDTQLQSYLRQHLHDDCASLTPQTLGLLYYRFPTQAWQRHMTRMTLTAFAHHCDSEEKTDAVTVTAAFAPVLQLCREHLPRVQRPYVKTSNPYESLLESLLRILDKKPLQEDFDHALALALPGLSNKDRVAHVNAMEHWYDVLSLPWNRLHETILALEQDSEYAIGSPRDLRFCDTVGSDYNDVLLNRLIIPAERETSPGPIFRELQTIFALAEHHRYWRYLALGLFFITAEYPPQTSVLFNTVKSTHQHWLQGDNLLHAIQVIEADAGPLDVHPQYWPVWIQRFMNRPIDVTATRASVWPELVPEWKEHGATWDALGLSAYEKTLAVQALRARPATSPDVMLPTTLNVERD